MARKPYPSDVTDEEWEFVAPYLTLIREDAPQRGHDLREVFDAMRWVVRTGSPWRYLPNDLPPWEAVYEQSRRWLAAGVFEAMAQDLRRVLRVLEGRREEPTAAIFDSRTLQSTPESGGRAGYDGAKRRKGPKVHMAVDTLGHLLSLHVTPASEQDRARVGRAGQGRAGAEGRVGGAGVRRPGLHRRAARRGGAGAGHRAVGGETAGGQARVRAAAEGGGWWSGASDGWRGSAGSRRTASGRRPR
jgi:transposase